MTCTTVAALCNSCATVVQVLQHLFNVLLQLLVVAAIILSYKFYCKFYCSCDPSFMHSRLDYCNGVLAGAPQSLVAPLQSVRPSR